MIRKLNWPAWLALVISILGFVSYFLLFVNWPATRDFPWANLVIFAVALVLLFVGVRRAFAPGRRLVSKIVAPIIAALCLLIVTGFVFVVFIFGRQLPPSNGAPQVGQKAPEFTLVDTNKQPVMLADLLKQPIDNKPPKGVLVIFYRGYW